MPIASGVSGEVQREKLEAVKEGRSVKMPTFLREVAKEIELEQENEEDYGWPIMDHC